MKQEHQQELSGLEAERQAILQRMERSRDGYRRLLNDEPEVQLDGHPHVGHANEHVEPLAVAGALGRYHDQRQLARFSAAHDKFPRSTTMRWALAHPVLCAAAVTAVIAIGPRRIARTVMASGTVASGLTLRNPKNIDLIKRVLSMVVDVAQSSNRR